jgi:hypothetical protein
MTRQQVFLQAIAATVLLAVALANPARAEGLYIGAGAYQSDSDIGDDTVPAGFIGYTFLDTNFLMLSVEGGYYDLGDTSDRTQKLTASAITAGAMASLPLGPFFELYAKGGVAFLDAELKQEGQNNNKQSDEKAYYGAGFAFDILDTIDIYAEYVVFDTKYNSDMAGVGIRLAF